jgi:hypothetical protein
MGSDAVRQHLVAYRHAYSRYPFFQHLGILCPNAPNLRQSGSALLEAA